MIVEIKSIKRLKIEIETVLMNFLCEDSWILCWKSRFPNTLDTKSIPLSWLRFKFMIGYRITYEIHVLFVIASVHNLFVIIILLNIP